VAAEDQNFARHHGFDFQAIERAQAHNQRMAERARRRGTEVRRLRGASTISQQTAKNLFLWQGSGATRWLRKGLEVWYTALVETLWPKRRIL
jgi:monofunctional biosynthetic peptidoglycan transglycosylase